MLSLFYSITGMKMAVRFLCWCYQLERFLHNVSLHVSPPGAYVCKGWCPWARRCGRTATWLQLCIPMKSKRVLQLPPLPARPCAACFWTCWPPTRTRAPPRASWRPPSAPHWRTTPTEPLMVSTSACTWTPPDPQTSAADSSHFLVAGTWGLSGTWHTHTHTHTSPPLSLFQAQSTCIYLYMFSYFSHNVCFVCYKLFLRSVLPCTMCFGNILYYSLWSCKQSLFEFNWIELRVFWLFFVKKNMNMTIL